MKTKPSFVMTTKLFLFFFICCTLSCNIEQPKKQETTKRKYTVRLSNWLGSDYHDCDSVIRITDQHLKLINNEDNNPFLEIIVPKDVTVRIYLNNN